MQISPLPPVPAAATGSTDKAATPPPRQPEATAVRPVQDDAQIVRAAEAALKASSNFDSRVTEIKRAVQEGRIRFDADVLAALILRQHGRKE